MAVKIDDSVEAYKQIQPLYMAYTQRLKDLAHDLLRANGIKFHLIESRTKSVESFEEKIKRPGKHYEEPLKQLPDLSGVRIILYYQDDLPKVEETLRKEFKILEAEKSHQPEGYEPDHFGYLSLHFIVQLGDVRSQLPEWRPYSEFRSEIQIRTVLQHSWAAISHALQYKRETDVPLQLRRKLFRLAGIFELADEEFVALKNAELGIHQQTKLALDKGDTDVPINRSSLEQLPNTWKHWQQVKGIAVGLGYDFSPAPIVSDDETNEAKDARTLGELMAHCERLNIRTTAELCSIIDYDPKAYLKAIKEGKWFVGPVFLILLLLIGGKADKFEVNDLTANGWSESIAERVITLARSKSWAQRKLK